MPVDPEYIEQLVLEEITGVISPEDREQLMELVRTDPAVKKIWDELHAQIPENYLQELEQKLSVELSADVIMDKIHERKRANRQKLIRGGGISLVAACVIIGLGILLFRSSVQNEQQPVAQQLLNSRVARLEMPGKKTILFQKLLDTLAQQDVTVYKNKDTIRFKHGEKIRDAWAIAPAGTSLYLILQDGSTIWLNAGSSVNFPIYFTGRTREVSIKGEAYLTIAKDPERPFIVNVPNGKVAVLGTSFSVNTLDRNNVSVALTQGRIQMRTFKDSLLLSPGQAVTFKQGQQLKAVPFDTAVLLKRQRGLYTFNNATVAGIMQELNRIRVITKVAGEDVEKMKFTGEINMRAPLTTILEDVKWENPELDYYVDYNGTDSVLHLLRKAR
jgi:hypothetical protein